MSLYRFVFSELGIYFDNNLDGMAISFHKSKLTKLGFQACCDL